MAREPSDEAKSKIRANQDLEDIETLRNTPAFDRYFKRRLLAELEKRRDAVLYDGNHTKDTLWVSWMKFLATYELSMMLLQDEAACRNLLSPNQGEE